MLLNVLLLLGIAAAGAHLRQEWREHRDREARLLGQKPNTLAIQRPPLPGASAPVMAASYLEVAQKLLFSRDRNPTVVPPPPPPPKPVPPPPPMPPLPSVFGVMALGGPPYLLMKATPADAQRPYQAGDTVGPFKLLAFDDTTAKFEWEGKEVVERLDKLVAQGQQKPAQAAAANAGASAPAVTAPVEPARAAPSEAPTGASYKFCTPGDNSPAGTVEGGYRKVINRTPFGNSCRWEPVG